LCILAEDWGQSAEADNGGTKMNWKRVCSVLAFVASISMLFSCASTTSTTTTSQTTTQTSSKTTSPVTTTTTVEKPKYGGTFTGIPFMSPGAWDATTEWEILGWQVSLQNEALIVMDWTKGPAGTGETDMTASYLGQTKLLGGWLAESWEMESPETLLFHIRKDATWQPVAPANGRVFTVEDAVWNIKTQLENPRGNFKNFFPDPMDQPVSVVARDDSTVEIKCQPGHQGVAILEIGARFYMMLPELYPKQSDWKYSLGTGAYRCTDFVADSMVTFTRNPNYWQKNPIGPGKGDQLPYIETLKFPIITDLSTQQASFRTGKIDMLGNLAPEEFREMKANTKWTFEYNNTFGFFNQPTGREDKELPFNNIKVRQAMNYAVDKVAIARDYYEGDADVMGFPYYNSVPLKALYTPLDQLPQECQDLIKGGNVEKAKQLMKEAGYENGFKTVIDCGTNDSDLLSIVKEDLKKINIDMEIKVSEAGALSSIERGFGWQEMFFKNSKQSFMPYYMFEMRPGTADNAAFWRSDETDKVYADIQKYLGIDDTKWSAELKAVTPLIIESSFSIWMPAPKKYNVWQPWLKNYFGATTQGNYVPFHHTYYNWLDTDLKKSLMGN
jgi:peptide/nickel transport system substrate-binding protein